jgi:hypothetical protein
MIHSPGILEQVLFSYYSTRLAGSKTLGGWLKPASAEKHLATCGAGVRQGLRDGHKMAVIQTFPSMVRAAIPKGSNDRFLASSVLLKDVDEHISTGERQGGHP